MSNAVADVVMDAITKTTGRIQSPATDYERGLCEMARLILLAVNPVLKAERDAFAERILGEPE